MAVEKNNEYEYFLDHIPEAIIIIQKGAFKFVNKTARDTIPIPASQLNGMNFLKDGTKVEVVRIEDIK